MLRAGAYALGFLAAVAVFYIWADPLKTLRSYPEYYADREQVNAGVVTLANFERHNARERYDSFIIGNSLSQYCYVADWLPLLPPGARPYHLSSSSQTVFTTRRFLEYAASRADTVRNVLIAFDVYALSDTTAGFHEYYDTDPPELFPPLLRLPAHLFHASHALNGGVLFGWAVRELTGRFPAQPHGYPRGLRDVEYGPVRNEIYWRDTEAWLDSAGADSVALLDGRGRLFPHRRYHVWSEGISPRVERELHALRASLDRTGADWRLVIVPCSSYAVPSARDDSIMRAVFGSRYYDASTALTDSRADMRSYLDAGHPRPRIFREIMRLAYGAR